MLFFCLLHSSFGFRTQPECLRRPDSHVPFPESLDRGAQLTLSDLVPMRPLGAIDPQPGRSRRGPRRVGQSDVGHTVDEGVFYDELPSRYLLAMSVLVAIDKGDLLAMSDLHAIDKVGDLFAMSVPEATDVDNLLAIGALVALDKDAQLALCDLHALSVLIALDNGDLLAMSVLVGLDNGDLLAMSVLVALDRGVQLALSDLVPVALEKTPKVTLLEDGRATENLKWAIADACEARPGHDCL
jgi:hypothetical protein